jgi:hypothetical protein
MRLQSQRADTIGHSDQNAAAGASAPARFMLLLEPKPGINPIRALRWALKGLLRHYGLGAISIREIDPAAGCGAASQSQPHALPPAIPSIARRCRPHEESHA